MSRTLGDFSIKFQSAVRSNNRRSFLGESQNKSVSSQSNSLASTSGMSSQQLPPQQRPPQLVAAPPKSLGGESTPQRSRIASASGPESSDIIQPRQVVSPIIADPEISVHKLTAQDQFLILACDGVWDVMSDTQAVRSVLHSLAPLFEHGSVDPDSPDDSIMQLAATELVHEAFRRGSTDNISVIVIRFRHHSTDPTAALQSEEYHQQQHLISSTSHLSMSPPVQTIVDTATDGPSTLQSSLISVSSAEPSDTP